MLNQSKTWVTTAAQSFQNLVVGMSAFVATCGAAVPDDRQVRSWHVEDGLPDGSVTAIAQTEDGILWVGTRKGLVRFDGALFARAGSDGADGLLDPRVSGLLAARDGSLWVLSERGEVTQHRGGKFQLRHAPPGFLSTIPRSAPLISRSEVRENPSESQISDLSAPSTPVRPALSLAFADGQSSVSAAGSPGYLHTLWRTAQLMPANWLAITSRVTNASGLAQLMDASPLPAEAFYRVTLP